MEHASTYSIAGFPEAVGIIFVIVTLSFALAPWFGGAEIASYKIPELKPDATRRLRVFGPLFFVLSLAAFYPLWPIDDTDFSAPRSIGVGVESANHSERRNETQNEGSTAPAVIQKSPVKPDVAYSTAVREEKVVYGCIGESLGACRQLYGSLPGEIEYHRDCRWFRANSGSNQNQTFADEVCRDLASSVESYTGSRIATEAGGVCGFGYVKIVCTIVSN